MLVVECLHRPDSYSREQVDRSLRIAYMLDRGRFVLCEAPALCPVCLGSLGEFCTFCQRH